MEIDCRNLDCPVPLIKTKNAINGMKIGENLEILVNSIPSKENIKRFLTTNKFDYEVVENEDETIIKTTKTKDLISTSVREYDCEIIVPNTTQKEKNKKVIFLNDDQTGSGLVGKNLLSKFLGSISNLDNKPFAIICVNNAVFMTTDRAHASYPVLKKLESEGVEIYSCGSCLESYKLVDKLSIGKITNAYEVMQFLMNYEVISL